MTTPTPGPPLGPGERLVLASHNAGKLAEIRELLAPRAVVSAGDLDLGEPEETGATFRENAALKAEAAAEASGLTALADDSGLAVEALDGAPGVRSARWAGPDKDFAAAMKRVWESLPEGADPAAAFVCVLALARPGRETRLFEGRVEGRIVWPPRGEGGFGYDPIFVPEGESRTFAEMSRAEKAAMSHRGRALRAFLEALG